MHKCYDDGVMALTCGTNQGTYCRGAGGDVNEQHTHAWEGGENSAMGLFIGKRCARAPSACEVLKYIEDTGPTSICKKQRRAPCESVLPVWARTM